MSNVDIKTEMEKVLKDNRLTPPECKFVEFSYSSEYAFARFEAVKQACDIIRDAIRKTGGDMPRDLMDAYEGLNNVMEHIKAVELDVIKVGR